VSAKPVPAKPDPPHPSLVAVVVTYNRLDKLRQTLARLLAVPRGDLAAVVVVDNASDDGTGDWLAGLDDPRLVVHRNAANTGGAGGFETGLRLARARFDPDWMVVMDDDARPRPGALAAFHALDFHARDKARWDAVAAAVYFPDGGICEMNRPSRNPFWHWRVFLRTLLGGAGGGGGRSGFHITPAAYDGPAVAVDVASFVGLFISRGAIDRVGYPDGRLFVYGEDGLFTLGLSRAGGRIGFEPSVAFEHDCSTFQGKTDPDKGKARAETQRGRFRPLWKVYYYHRNLLLLYRLAAGWLFWPALLVVLPRWLVKVRHHSGERGAFLRLLGRAVGDGLAGRTGVDHAQVLALAAQIGAQTGAGGAERTTGSEYRDDSGPEG